MFETQCSIDILNFKKEHEANWSISMKATTCAAFIDFEPKFLLYRETTQKGAWLWYGKQEKKLSQFKNKCSKEELGLELEINAMHNK